MIKQNDADFFYYFQQQQKYPPPPRSDFLIYKNLFPSKDLHYFQLNEYKLTPYMGLVKNYKEPDESLQ